MFIVSEIAKWKCQSLYDCLKKNRFYNPIVGLTCQDVERNLHDDTVLVGIERAEKFFYSHGVSTVRLYGAGAQEGAQIKDANPDIVFYQQPWNVDYQLSPGVISKVALPCYVPYFVPNYSYDDLTYGQLFHRFLRYYFVLNEDAACRGRKLRRFLDFAGTLPVVGHPMLDDFYLNPIEDPKKPCVIYAPHFTFSHPNNPVAVHYSTFLNTGGYLLKYAKMHPEMNWVFKPHPVLRTALQKSGAWSGDKIDEYYSEWAKIGRVCETGDYLPLFREATAMITDCGSFLSEFAVTNKPIIHLVNPENNLQMPELFNTYYKVHNIEELGAVLRDVLEEGNDYKKDVRVMAVEKANLSGTYAAKNIMDFFDKEFKIKR